VRFVGSYYIGISQITFQKT